LDKRNRKKDLLWSNESNKENLPDISNSHLTYTKDVFKKYMKSTLKDSKYHSKDKIHTITNNLQDSNY
ncbi:1893_t:CDS:1, partial [Cetraspora pellucida]